MIFAFMLALEHSGKNRRPKREIFIFSRRPNPLTKNSDSHEHLSRLEKRRKKYAPFGGTKAVRHREAFGVRALQRRFYSSALAKSRKLYIANRR
jgi:hypothetical protein